MNTPTATKPITPEELLEMGSAGKGFELVNGELQELNMSKESGRATSRLIRYLDEFADNHDLGYVYNYEPGFRCFPDEPNKIRRPDAAYISVESMPVETYEDEGFCTTVPDLIVEVVSPNDIAEMVEGKIQDWLDTGVKVLLEVYPATRTIRIHRPDGTIEVLRSTNTLTIPEILPGFSVPVANLFRLPTQSA